MSIDLEEPFLNATLAEVLGAYRPGGHTIVLHRPGHLPEVTAAHESAHRVLTTNSSFGHLLVALAFAGDQPRNDAARAFLHETVRDAVRCCYMTQEGYATYAQVMYCRRIGNVAAEQITLSTLHRIYRTALDPFEAMFPTQPYLNRRDERYLVSAAMDYVGCLMALAAMSAPLDGLLRAGAPIARNALAEWLEANSPDTRLRTIFATLTEAHYAEYLHYFCGLAVLRAIHGDPRMIDGGLAIKARELCAALNLPHELPQPSRVDALVRLLPTDTVVNSTGLWDSTPEDIKKRERSIRLVSSAPFPTKDAWHFPPDLSQPLELARHLLEMLRGNKMNEEILYVVEVNSEPDEAEADVIVHTYVPLSATLEDDILRQQRETLDVMDPRTPVKLCMTRAKGLSLDCWGSALRLAGWPVEWVVGYEYTSRSQIETLRKYGVVHCTLIDTRRNLPSHSAAEAFKVLGLPPSLLTARIRNGRQTAAEEHSEALPQNAGLEVLHITGDADFDCSLSAVVPLRDCDLVGETVLPTATFEQSCVADVLYCGWWSAVTASRFA
jgi:hypothetical protein